MDVDRQEPHLPQAGLAFFGRVTASVSHEINNVLSILTEYAGLLQDYVQGAAAGRPIQPERLKGLADSLDKQLRRGERIIKRLNRFSHAADKPVSTFGLDELVTDAVELARRSADLKRIGLELDLPGGDFSLESDPFALHHAIATCIQLALELSKKGETVQVSLARLDACYRIETACASGTQVQAGTPRRSLLDALMKHLGGRVDIDAAADQGARFVLSIPHGRAGQDGGEDRS